jgi:glycosyltransferase involved in cell wall biosynthesis
VLFLGKKDLPTVVEARAAGLKVDNSLSFNPMGFFDDLRRMSAIIEDFEPDVINAHRPQGMNFALLSRILSRRKNLVVVRTRVEIRPVRRNVFNRWLYRRLDGVVTPWIEGRDRHLALGMGEERVATLPGGVDTERFRPDVDGAAVRGKRSIPPEAPLVGMVARLDPVKGHVYFIDAAKRVLERIPEAHFMIIGEEFNVKLEDLKNLAKELGIAERVRFVGRRPDVERYVAAFDIGVVASIGSEVLSRVALEYMAAGKAIVATYVGGLPFIIEPELNGVLVPPQNPEQLAQAIIMLIENTEMRKRIGAEARARAVQYYSISQLAGRTAEFYEKLIGMRR